MGGAAVAITTGSIGVLGRPAGFVPTSPDAETYVWALEAALTPRLEADAKRNVKESRRPVDYLVISGGRLLPAAAEELAAYRESRGLSALVADWEDTAMNSTTACTILDRSRIS